MNTNMQIAGVADVTKKVVDPITRENVLSVTFLRENGLFTVRCRSKQFHKYFKNQADNADYGDTDGKWDRSVRSNSRNQLVEIGNRTNSYKNIKGQYMGVFKIDPVSWQKIKKHLFKNVKNLNKIDITALFQLIIKKNFCNIYVENYKKKWFEIDNVKDYKILKKSIEY